MTVTARATPDAGAPMWFARDVAAALTARQPAGTAPAAVHTVTQYLWLRGKHIRDDGAAEPGDIPEPDDYRRLPGQRGGPLRPAWRPATITPWVETRQPPGGPRGDQGRRVTRADVIGWVRDRGWTTTPEVMTGTGASYSTVRRTRNMLAEGGALETGPDGRWRVAPDDGQYHPARPGPKRQRGEPVPNHAR